MKRNYRVERLARHEEKQVIRRIFTLSALSIVIIVVIFTLGIPALGKFADAMNTIFKKNSDTTSQQEALLAPHLDDLPKATNQKNINVTGFAVSGDKAQLYLGDQESGESDIASGKFEFSNVTLNEGENTLKAKVAASNGKTSDFSEEKTIILDTTEPSLDVSSPTSGQSFNGDNRIKVSGKSEKDAQVFANNFLANVDSDGNFEVTVPLVEGDNTIEVKAQDEAGNTKTVEIKVGFHK